MCERVYVARRRAAGGAAARPLTGSSRSDAARRRDGEPSAPSPWRGATRTRAPARLWARSPSGRTGPGRGLAGRCRTARLCSARACAWLEPPPWPCACARARPVCLFRQYTERLHGRVRIGLPRGTRTTTVHCTRGMLHCMRGMCAAPTAMYGVRSSGRRYSPNRHLLPRDTPRVSQRGRASRWRERGEGRGGGAGGVARPREGARGASGVASVATPHHALPWPVPPYLASHSSP